MKNTSKFLNVLKIIIQHVFFYVKKISQHNERISNSWDSNFKSTQTKFKKMDKEFIKYN